MIAINKTIKVANRIGSMIELVKETAKEGKVFCPFFRKELKQDKDGNIFVTEQAYKAKFEFLNIEA